jgi:hypothetical protein
MRFDSLLAVLCAPQLWAAPAGDVELVQEAPCVVHTRLPAAGHDDHQLPAPPSHCLVLLQPVAPFVSTALSCMSVAWWVLKLSHWSHGCVLQVCMATGGEAGWMRGGCH